MYNKIYEKIKSFILNNYKFLIGLILIIFLFTYQTDYVVYKPGGIVKLSNRINIDDKYKSDGELSMSYVSMVKGTIPAILVSYIIPNWDLIPKKDITVDNESVSELLKLEKLYMQSSIDNATILAYNKAGRDIKINSTVNNVVYITKKAKTDIEIYDQILEVENNKVNNLKEVKDIIKKHNVGDEIKILVKRGNKKVMTTSKVYKDKGYKLVGISSLNTYKYETKPKISVKTKRSESGSSGGLMLSLAIYNALTKSDLTKGLNIVGTGTIEVDGTVGDIDGVKYKLLGAVKNKADIFMCPKNNYKEAMKVKKKNNLDIKIVSVKTFDDAINYLNSL